MKKVLIIRFSSFGDILQCLPVATAIKSKYPDATIDWVVRSDSKTLLEMSTDINQVFELKRQDGLGGLIKLSKNLSSNKYELIYDAHNNLRSHIFVWSYKFYSQTKFKFLRRSKQRLKRFLLFKLRVNLFPKPYKGAISYLEPLKNLGTPLDFKTKPLNSPQVTKPFDKYICLAPSAAWEMKRWPIEYWRELIEIMPEYNFVLLGGPHDDFIQHISNSPRVKNFAGTLSWPETTSLIKQSQMLVSNDTGSLHLADVQGIPCIALMGPTAFGTPSGPLSKTLSSGLSCQPCSKDGRGKCKQKIYKLCLIQLTPLFVKKAIKETLNV